MIQHYVLCSASLFFAFWSGRPALSFAVVLAFHVFWTGLFEFESGASRPQVKDFAFYLPLSTLFGTVIGAGMALVIDKPIHPLRFDTCRKIVYHVECLARTILWIGSLVMWQLLDQTWWNYLFLGLVLQLAIIVVSYFFVAHERAWDSPENSRDSFVVHWHFLLVSIVFLDIPFVIGQSVSDVWPFRFSIVFLCAASLYALLINTIHSIRVAAYLPDAVQTTSPIVVGQFSERL